MTLTERIGASEQVLIVLKEEGDMAKPSDTRCQAATKEGNRCKRSVFYNQDSDTWMKFCEQHSTQLQEARLGEAAKPVVYTGKDE